MIDYEKLNSGFVELIRPSGSNFLFHINTSWEIDDRGNDPAWWTNHEQGRNFNCINTYKEIKDKFGVK